VPGLDRVVGEDAPHGRRRDRIGDPGGDDFKGEVQAGPLRQRHAVLGGQFAGQRYDLGPLHLGEQPRATRVPVRARCRLPRPSDRGIATTMGPTSVDAECASDLPVGLRATRVRPVAGRVCPGHGVAWPAPAGRLDEVARRRPGIGGRCRRGGAAWRWALAGWPTSANRAANIASAQLRHGRCRRAPHLALTAPGRRPAREKHQPPSEASLGPAELRGDAGRGARGAVVGGGAVRRRPHNERKLPLGPAVRFADRRHPLRRGPDGRHRARLCHQSGWSGMRLQVVERATATLLVGENSSKPLDES